MNLRNKILPVFLLILICSDFPAQNDYYSYKRELKDISGQWNKVVLPDDIFGKVSADFSDIRILGIKENGDTVEAPYILKLSEEKSLKKELDFKLINQSQNNTGYYFTFETSSKEPINLIYLDFKQRNFDWHLTLAGSQDQMGWFTIAENYRIVSVKNSLTDYQFTKVAFPNSLYHYFRIVIKSKDKPELTVAKIAFQETTDGTFREYPIKNMAIKEDKQNKQTVIDLSLKFPVPVCRLMINISDTFDYYRPIAIKYLADSFKTEVGWKYNYNSLVSGTLSSIDKSEFKFSSAILQNLRIVINNQDNQPLKIDSFIVRGYVHELISRITEQAYYFFFYGNNENDKPDYDLIHFADKVPDVVTEAGLGVEQIIEKKEKGKISPLFKNKKWLWGIMTIVILLLGWFSLKMMTKK